MKIKALCSTYEGNNERNFVVEAEIEELNLDGAELVYRQYTNNSKLTVELEIFICDGVYYIEIGDINSLDRHYGGFIPVQNDIGSCLTRKTGLKFDLDSVKEVLQFSVHDLNQHSLYRPSERKIPQKNLEYIGNIKRLYKNINLVTSGGKIFARYDQISVNTQDPSRQHAIPDLRTCNLLRYDVGSKAVPLSEFIKEIPNFICADFYNVSHLNHPRLLTKENNNLVAQTLVALNGHRTSSNTYILETLKPTMQYWSDEELSLFADNIDFILNLINYRIDNRETERSKFFMYFLISKLVDVKLMATPRNQEFFRCTLENMSNLSPSEPKYRSIIPTIRSFAAEAMQDGGPIGLMVVPNYPVIFL